MKILIASFLMLVFIGFTNKVNAEKVQFYAGSSFGSAVVSTFSIRFTFDDSTKLQKISFLADNKWNDFQILGVKKSEDWAGGDDFYYSVKDLVGNVNYSLVYFTKNDNIQIMNMKTSELWVLNRRKN